MIKDTALLYALTLTLLSATVLLAAIQGWEFNATPDAIHGVFYDVEGNYDGEVAVFDPQVGCYQVGSEWNGDGSYEILYLGGCE